MLLSGVAVFGLAGCGDDVTVVQPDPNDGGQTPVPNVVNPTVTIASVNSNTTGGPVDLGNVSGQVDVVINVNPGSYRLASVEVLLGTQVVASQTFTTAQIQQMLDGAVIDGFSAQLSGQVGGVQTITISIPTNRLTTAGAPQFPNATYALSVRATFAPGTGLPSTAPQNPVVTSTNTLSLTFNNQSSFVASITNTPTTPAAITPANGTATGPDLLLWRQGNITITLAAVNFTAGATNDVAQINARLVELDAAGNDSAGGKVIGPFALTRSGTTNNYSATISGTSSATPNPSQTPANLNSVSGRFRVDVVGSATTGGQPGPVTTTGERILRVDNVAPGGTPVLGTQAASPFFAGTTSTLTASSTSTAGTVSLAGVTDRQPGVGGVRTTFFIGTAADVATYVATPNATTITPLTAVTGNGTAQLTALAETNVNTTYAVVAVTSDALGNVTSRLTQTFGADRTAPTATVNVGSLADSARVTGAAPGSNITLGLTDNASGFGSNPLFANVRRINPNGTATCVIGTANATGTACSTVATANPIPTTTFTQEGYYTVTFEARDQAGNATAPQTRVFIVDRTAPTFVGGISIPNNIAGNASVTFNAEVQDNLDLDSGYVALRYGALGVVPTFPGVDLGTPFDGSPVTTANFTATIPNFIRSLSIADGDGEPSASQTLVSQVEGVAVDAAGNIGAQTAAIPAINVDTAGLTNFASAEVGLVEWAITSPADGASIRNGTAAPTDVLPGSRTFTATGTLASNSTNNPFTTVSFWWVDGGRAILIGSTMTGTISVDGGGARTVTFTSPAFNPPARLGTSADVTIVAVGQNVAGDAIATNLGYNITLVP